MGLNDIPQIPFNNSPAGVDMGSVAVIQSGGRLNYVRSTGPQDGDPPELTGRIIPTIAAALAYCRSGAMDVIYVLPGHVESVSTATYFSALVAGTRIIGLGDGQNRPTLTWTATASAMLLNKANVTIENMRLLLAPNAGSVTVTAAITISAAGVTIRRCYIEVGTTAARLTTTAITLASGADDCVIVGNTIWGDTTAAITDSLLVNAAVKRPVIAGNDIQVAVGVAEGVITFATAAAVDIQVNGNRLVNKTAISTVAFKGIASLTGDVTENYMGIQQTSGAASTPVNTPGNAAYAENYASVPGKVAILTGTLST